MKILEFVLTTALGRLVLCAALFASLWIYKVWAL